MTMWKKIGSVILILMISVSLYAETTLIKSSVDQQTVPINGVLTLTLSLDGSKNIPHFKLPELSDFTILGQSTATQIQIINSQQTRTQSYVYNLKPKRQGKLNIPAFQVQFEGKTYQTEPIAITVTGFVTPNAQSNQSRRSAIDDFFNDDFFGNHFAVRQRPINLPPAHVLVDYTPQKTTLYQGEKTDLNFKLYFDRPFSAGPLINFPHLTDFIEEGRPRELKSMSPKSVVRDGKPYNLVSWTQTIYASSSGDKTIPSLQVQYADNPFEEPKTAASKPIKLHVLSLPTPQPDAFSGAVGSFTIKIAPLSTTSIKANEPVRVVIALTGQGNADMINSLKLPKTAGLTWFLDSIDTNGSKGQIVQKKFTYFFTPSQSGTIHLPAFRFCYFNPETKQYLYAEATIPPFQIKNGNSSASSPIAQTSTSSTGASIKSGVLEIRLDKTLLYQVKRNAINLFKVLFCILFLGIGFFTVYRLRSSPKIQLKKQIDQLERQYDAPPLFLQDFYSALTALVKLNFKLNLTGTTKSLIQAKIKDKHKATVLIELISQYEELHYSPMALSEAAKKSMLDKLKLLV